MIARDGQAHQTVAPAWVARALLIDPDWQYTAHGVIGNRCWTSDVPDRAEYQNDLPACVVSEAAGTKDRQTNTEQIEGVLAVRVFGGSSKLSDCWKTWQAIRQALIMGGGREYTIDECNFSARWLWAVEVSSPVEIRMHPITRWPELNCMLEFGVQGI